MNDFPHEKVLTGHELLKKLLTAAPDRRFTGTTTEQFNVWRTEFADWLWSLLERFNVSRTVPQNVDVKILNTQSWHNCTRTELLYHNAELDLTVPATVLDPPKDQCNGAGLVCQHGHGSFGRLAVIGDRSTPERSAEIDKNRYDFGLHFAQAGYTVIAIDLLNFGSRAMRRLENRDACDMLGLWLGVCGQNAVAVQISDIRHAVTVLSQWQTVDAGRIGMAGLSQGGRMTMYTTALDDRIRAAVASGSCNTCKDRIGRLSGLCGMQTVPGLMPHADHEDIFAAIAPRPLQLQWGSADSLIIKDYAEPAIEIIKKAYTSANALDHLHVHRFTGKHVFDFNPALAFFHRHL